MISHMSHTNVFVFDQESAKAFYTEKLGFELRFDITMGEEFEGAGAGFRWLTVGPKDQPDLQIILASCDMGRAPEAAAQLRALVASGSMGVGVMATDDCHQTYKELLGQGRDLPLRARRASLRHRGDDARRLGQHDQPGATEGVRRGRRAAPRP